MGICACWKVSKAKVLKDRSGEEKLNKGRKKGKICYVLILGFFGWMTVPFCGYRTRSLDSHCLCFRSLLIVVFWRFLLMKYIRCSFFADDDSDDE